MTQRGVHPLSTSPRWFTGWLGLTVSMLVVAGGCTGDDAAPVDTLDGGSIVLAPPPTGEPDPSNTFVERVLDDDSVTADELDAAYRGYIQCLSDGGVSGVYAWDLSLDVGVVVDGLAIEGDDENGSRLVARQDACQRDYLDDLTRRYQASNPQDPSDLLTRQRASIVDCVAAIDPAVAANIPADLTVDTQVEGAATIDLQLDPTALGATGDELLPVDRCLGSFGAPYTAFG